MLKVQHKLRLTMQHVYGHTGNLGNECADHAAALGTLGLVSSHNYLHVGLVIILIKMLALVLATTLEMSWTNCVTLELKEPRYLRMGDSALFLTGFSFVRTHASHRFWLFFSSFSLTQP